MPVEGIFSEEYIHGFQDHNDSPQKHLESELATVYQNLIEARRRIQEILKDHPDRAEVDAIISKIFNR